MANVKDYGKVYTSDILIIGGGMCGLVTAIKAKEGDLKGNMASEGTTPRRLTDLIGSLCDLTSGSGDKGTPIVLVQNYFNNYAN